MCVIHVFFGLTRTAVMALAYEIASRNGISHVGLFSQEKKTAGKVWLKLFLQRHPEVSLRQPEATSIARATGFNRSSVGRFFNLLEREIDRHRFTGMTIYNMDETAVSTVQKKCQKVLGRRGKHQIRALTSGERGTTTTVVCCCNAAGQYVPPFVLFKRKRMQVELGNGAPTGSLVTHNESGWMDKETFPMWLKHFSSAVRPSQANKVLLILDGHCSRTRSIEAIEYAREHGIVMLSLPPHTTHKLQPLDVSFFKPLQTFYAQQQEAWLRANPGRQITAHQICSLFNSAYVRAASTATAVNGFAETGIWPCNRSVFTEADFTSTCSPEDTFSSTPPNISTGCNHYTLSPCSTGCEIPPSTSPTGCDIPHYTQPYSSTGCDIPISTLPSSSTECHIASSTPPPSSTHSAQPTEFDRCPPVFSPLGGDALVLVDRKVIETNADGLCFFRSIAISSDNDLQSTERDANGISKDVHLRLREQFKADGLRANVVQHMLENIRTNNYTHLEAALNIDMPRLLGHSFSSVEERVLHMSSPKASIGELEIVSTSDVLKRPIHVTLSANGNVIRYNDAKFAPAPPVMLLYSSFGDSAGHYDCILPSHVSVSVISPLPLPLSQVTKRPARKTEAEVLTDSPHKNKLLSAKTKQRRTMIPSQINNIKKRKERKLKREQLHGHQTQRTLLGIVLCVASAALRT